MELVSSTYVDKRFCLVSQKLKMKKICKLELERKEIF